ncbi:hypothetical protein DEO72_LG7g688 [Vigna unguiculata]|uniref:Uncharacterized protein n=1 Tax=Vigna unguiculata TaxID=3917 RepID=A0A4D6MEI6_VIGUN|nr:hypothetical protein DEO72_LG7g688 [Vigna unguiculata]
MSRAKPLSRATTQGIRSEPRLKGYVPSYNSRNTPASPPLRYHLSFAKHAYYKQTSLLTLHYRLTLLLSCQVNMRSRPPGRASCRQAPSASNVTYLTDIAKCL